jgi:hypothetical protein
MTKGIALKTKVRFGTGKRSRKELREGTAPEPRLPRIAKLMAPAIRFDQLVCDGQVADYADLARLGHVTRARMTQIINLLNLAPDIQETLLFLSPVESGKNTVAERQLRVAAEEADWKQQRNSKLLRSK